MAGRLAVTVRARKVLLQLHATVGEQILLLVWPGGVTCLPAHAYEPGPYNVIVAHIAGCPVYSDIRQLAMFQEQRLVIDALEASRSAGSVLGTLVGSSHA